MKIKYISGIYNDEIFNSVYDKDKKPMQAASKFHRLLSYGLAENNVDVEIWSVLPVSRENCSKKYVHIKERDEGNLRISFAPIVNFPGIKHFLLFWYFFFKTLFSSRDTLILYDVLTVSASFGALCGALLSNKEKIAVVTDLPQFQQISNRTWMLNVNNKLLDEADGYVLLTKAMNTVVNKRKKPYIIIEGLVDGKMANQPHDNFDERIKKVLYAGSLKKIYGIGNLCKAFIACGFKNTELHIYGDGDYVGEIKELQKKHESIIYHGNRPNSEVVSAELNSVLLVNPRPTEGEYTKYSFPSKTLEYMVSGTPVLSAKLEGIPVEYDDYLFYFDDKDPKGLENALRNILGMSVESLNEHGKKSREFVLKNKDHISQSMKLKKFLVECGTRKNGIAKKK